MARTIAIIGLLIDVGCARRVNLSLAEFDELRQLDPSQETLRVFPGKKLISSYPEEQEVRNVDIKRDKVVVRGAQRPRERIIGVNTPGKVVAVDELNGMPLLWVTYFADCGAADCAYGFVLTEQKKFSLVAIPGLAGFDDPTSHRGTRTRRNRLRLGKIRSLSELNEVYVVPRRRGKKFLSLDLQIHKETYKPTRKSKQRAPGV